MRLRGEARRGYAVMADHPVSLCQVSEHVCLNEIDGYYSENCLIV